MDTTDHMLVDRARCGDVEAFAELARRHQAAVRACAFAVTLRSELAEDLTQDAFLIAWQKLDTLDDPGRFGAWLSGIARNLAKKSLRIRGREVGLVEDEQVSEAGDPESAVLAHEYRALLETALRELSQSDLEILALFYGEGGSSRAVAEALGITEQAAQKRVSRARRGLSAEVDGRLADSARRRRSTTAIVAAIVAAIAAPGAASASSIVKPTAKGTLAMTMFKLLLPAAAALAVVAVVVAAADGRDPERRLQQTADQVAPAPRSTSTTRRPSIDSAQQQNVPRKGAYAPPASYRLTEILPDMVAVDLDGGHSGLYRPDPDPPRAVVRQVKGVVRSLSGQPVAGVVVIADKTSFSNELGRSISADAGDTTDDAGRFALELRHDDPAVLLALHPEGWSLPARVRAGRSDLLVDLELEPLAVVRGTVRRGDEGVEAELSVTTGDGLDLSFKTDVDGSYQLHLPEGSYTIAATLAQSLGAGHAKPRKVEVDLDSRAAKERDIELPVGGLLVAEAKISGIADDFESILMLIPGHHQPQAPRVNPRDLMSYGLKYSKGSTSMLQGNSFATPSSEWVDIEAGPYTVCLDVVSWEKERRHHFECRQVEVEDEPMVVEFELSR